MPSLPYDTPTTLETVTEIADRAARLVPPLWPLDGFVAVNPFWGMRDQNFCEALQLVQQLSRRGTLPPSSFYQELARRYQLTERDVSSAFQQLDSNQAPAPSYHVSGLNPVANHSGERAQSNVSPVLSEVLNRCYPFDCSYVLEQEISKFLALFFDRGQAALPSPLQTFSLWDAWIRFASTDYSLELLGIPGARQFFHGFTDRTPEAVLAMLSSRLDLDSESLHRFFACELFTMPGWAAYLQHLDFEEAKQGASAGRVRLLLAIRSAYNLLFLERAEDESVLPYYRHVLIRQLHAQPPHPQDDLRAKLAVQVAAERQFVRALSQSLRAPTCNERVRPRMQALFCIDVRSEAYRQALERQSSEVETYGFAGFFGLTCSYREVGSNRSIAQYPVLLSETFSVRECVKDAERNNSPAELPWRDRARHNLALLVRLLRQSVCSGFSYVEALGVFYAFKMLRHTAASGKPIAVQGTRAHTTLHLELTPEEKCTVATKLLRNSGLRQPYAPIVLLCGHRAAVTNNPYAASLDCGACGGHGGEVNARAAATLLNDPEVRSRLKGTEFEIPGDTTFIPAVHITTTGEVKVLEQYSDELPDDINRWLRHAADESRRTLAVHLDHGQQASPSATDFIRRSADWSEVRPEWGLARNTAFIAARRIRTRGLSLDNRCFLHEYDAEQDTDRAVLELIMTAPMVVASWINLQYYGSSVLPELFGAGTKTIHNVVGQLGTVLGNGGDLCIGLPLQSVHTGKRLFHEPLRLQVIIEAPPEAIDTVIAKHQLLHDLVKNEWVCLHSLQPTGSKLLRRSSSGGWLTCNDHPERGPTASVPPLERVTE